MVFEHQHHIYHNYKYRGVDINHCAMDRKEVHQNRPIIYKLYNHYNEKHKKLWLSRRLTAHGASLSPPAHIIHDLIPHDLHLSSLHCSFDTRGISTCFKTFSCPVPFVSPHPNIMHFLLLMGSWYESGIWATSITSFFQRDNILHRTTVQVVR